MKDCKTYSALEQNVNKLIQNVDNYNFFQNKFIHAIMAWLHNISKILPFTYKDQLVGKESLGLQQMTQDSLHNKTKRN